MIQHQRSVYQNPKLQVKLFIELIIIATIDFICEHFPQYGFRKIKAQLHIYGLTVNGKKIQRILKQRGLTVRRPSKKVKARKNKVHYLNLIKGRHFTNINEAWVADITDIRFLGGVVYLAVIEDICSRRVVGFAFSLSKSQALVLKALDVAIETRNPPRGVIHHSDNGGQYDADKYIEKLNAHGFQISRSKTSTPSDNPHMERFNGILKSEEVNMREYITFEDVIVHIKEYINFYNNERISRVIGDMSPRAFEAKKKIITLLLHKPF